MTHKSESVKYRNVLDIFNNLGYVNANEIAISAIQPECCECFDLDKHDIIEATYEDSNPDYFIVTYKDARSIRRHCMTPDYSSTVETGASSFTLPIGTYDAINQVSSIARLMVGGEVLKKPIVVVTDDRICVDNVISDIVSCHNKNLTNKKITACIKRRSNMNEIAACYVDGKFGFNQNFHESTYVSAGVFVFEPEAILNFQETIKPVRKRIFANGSEKIVISFESSIEMSIKLSDEVSFVSIDENTTVQSLLPHTRNSLSERMADSCFMHNVEQNEKAASR